MYCPKCGAPRDPAASPRFCNQCGAPLAFSDARQGETVTAPPDETPDSTGQPPAGKKEPQKENRAVPAKKSRQWMFFAAAALLIAVIAAVVLIVSIAVQKKDTGRSGAGNGTEQSRAINPMQLISGIRQLLETNSCDFDLLADNGSVHVTGTVSRAEDLMDSCAILRLPDADGKEAYAYLHEGRLMMVRGDDYITGLNIKGMAELLESKGGSTLDTVLQFFRIETTDLTYEDCVVLFGAMREAIQTLQADLDEKERLNDLFSIVMETAIPLLKLRDAKEITEANKASAMNLLEAFVQNGISPEALSLSGSESGGQTAAELTLTPAVFFREFVAFCKESADFASICENLQTTPEEVLAPYTDEALQNTFGDNQAVLTIVLSDTTITAISADYGENQVFTITLSNHNVAAVDTEKYEFIETMRTDPNVENNYIDNVFDFIKQLF